MANELDIFKGGVPDFMKSGELDEATKTIVGAGKKLGGPRRISIKGGVFRSMQGGQEIAKDDSISIITSCSSPTSNVKLVGSTDTLKPSESGSINK